MTAASDPRSGPSPRARTDASTGTYLLEVDGLTVRAGGIDLVTDLRFTVGRGERVGLIGESGSGKSITALALMGLLGEGLSTTGEVRLAGHSGNLLRAGESTLSGIRGDDMAMVFQEPMTALNPTMRVGRQVAEVITIHRRGDRGEARARAIELLGRVGLPDPEHTATAYPHQLSGGQRQRVVLAMALANDPPLLICDEPTTALDVTVQALVLREIVAGVEERDAAMLFITHDLAVVATVCERVLVMYGGRIVESGPVDQVFTDPRHRYTQGLLAASDIDAAPQGDIGAARPPLPTIPGTVPAAGAFPQGCVFRNRCGHADAACERQPEWIVTGADLAPVGPSATEQQRGYACWHPAGVGA